MTTVRRPLRSATMKFPDVLVPVPEEELLYDSDSNMTPAFEDKLIEKFPLCKLDRASIQRDTGNAVTACMNNQWVFPLRD